MTTVILLWSEYVDVVRERSNSVLVGGFPSKFAFGVGSKEPRRMASLVCSRIDESSEGCDNVCLLPWMLFVYRDDPRTYNVVPPAPRALFEIFRWEEDNNVLHPTVESHTLGRDHVKPARARPAIGIFT
jgi:hypothetical protein